MLFFREITLADAVWLHDRLGWTIEIDGDDGCATCWDKDGNFLGTATLH